MQKEHGKMFLWGTLLLLCSCIDGTYDLSKKEIMTDMKIEGNKLALPIGNLLPMQLDSMLDIDDLEMLKEIDGVYSLAMSDTVGPFSIEIPPIALSIPPITHEEEFSFKDHDIKIEDITIAGINEDIDFNIANVSIEDLNDVLPAIDENVTLAVMSDGLETLLNTFGSNIPSQTFDFKHAIDHDESSPLSFRYELPKEVKCIHNIDITSPGGNSKGALTLFTINVPKRLENIENHLEFKIDFPKEMSIALNESATGGTYKLEGNTLTVKDLTIQNGTAQVSFYINGFTGIDNPDFYKQEGDKCYFEYDDAFHYTINFSAEGKINIDSSIKKEDFNLSINAYSKFSLFDATGDTNPIEFNFDKECFDFSAKIENLNGVSEIKYVALNPHTSKANLYIKMPDAFHPFNLRKGDSFIIDIPKNVRLNEELSVFPEGIVYDKNTNYIHIYDANVFEETTLVLALDSIIVNQPIINDEITVLAQAHIKTSGDGVQFDGATVSLRRDLAALKQKNIKFGMDDANISVDEVDLVIEPINETFHEVMMIDIDETIEKGIDRIYTVGFREEVDMNLDFTLTGLEDITTPIFIDIAAQLPPFISLESDDTDVTIKDNTLNIHTQYKPGAAFSKQLRITELDFTQMPDGYLAPKVDEKGQYRLQYSDSIIIDAKASLEETEVSSDLLNKKIAVNMNFNIDDIVLEEFEGIVNLDVDKIEESIELNLGEEMDFLNNGESRLVLSEPQIMIALENSINVPVLVDLAILGKDEHGNVIETSRIELKELRINPAHYDETTGAITPDSTKYLFAPSKEITKQGYETVELPNLATLLQELPQSISFELLPRIDVSTTHHINLSQSLSFGGSYSVVVPFKFDDLYVSYTDTIADLNMEMAEIAEYFSNMELHLRMNIKNTLPLGLTLNVTPLDANGKKLTNLEINEVKIAAGNGEAIKGSSEGTAVELSIKSKGKADFSALDQLAFTLEAYANQTVGGAALKPVQGIQITDIVIEACGDIEFDLKDMNE